MHGALLSCNSKGTAYEDEGCPCTVDGAGFEASCLIAFGDGGPPGADGGAPDGAGGTSGCVRGSANHASITDFENLGGDGGSYYGYTSDNVNFTLVFSDRDGTSTSAGVDSPGAGSSRFAGHLAWSDAVSGGAMTLTFASCYDASPWHGLSWQSKGSAPATVTIRTSDARAFRYDFTPASSTTWNANAVSWSELAADAGLSLQPVDISVIEIEPHGSGSLDLWIDDLGWE